MELPLECFISMRRGNQWHYGMHWKMNDGEIIDLFIHGSNHHPFRIPVYRFEGIRFGVLLARAKLVQTIASVLYLPYSTFGLLMGTNDKQTFLFTFVLAVAAPLLLGVFSRYCKRREGVLYEMNSDI